MYTRQKSRGRGRKAEARPRQTFLRQGEAKETNSRQAAKYRQLCTVCAVCYADLFESEQNVLIVGSGWGVGWMVIAEWRE